MACKDKDYKKLVERRKKICIILRNKMYEMQHNLISSYKYLTHDKYIILTKSRCNKI